MNDNIVSARDVGLAGCHVCDQVVRLQKHDHGICPRCGCEVHYRKQNSVTRTWALLISAIIMYVPANTEPIMKTTSLGVQSADTIISGVIYFLKHGDWPIALVIFTASVMVPLLKMMAIAFILISIQKSKLTGQKDKTRLYLIAGFLGRWSMVDIFVVALMIVLVQMGELTSIVSGPAAFAFASVVILTMIAEEALDPKLIWDAAESNNGK